MSDRPSQLDRLLIRTRRQWIGVLLVEGAALGAACGCAAAIVAVGFAWLLGDTSRLTGLALLLIAVGGGLGCLIAWMRRPAMGTTAQRLDDRHGLHDLLSTAFAFTSPGGRSNIEASDPTWRGVVRAQANAAAAMLPPDAIRFARWSARMHGAVAVGVGVTLVLAALAEERSAEERSAGPAGRAWSGALEGTIRSDAAAGPAKRPHARASDSVPQRSETIGARAGDAPPSGEQALSRVPEDADGLASDSGDSTGSAAGTANAAAPPTGERPAGGSFPPPSAGTGDRTTGGAGRAINDAPHGVPGAGGRVETGFGAASRPVSPAGGPIAPAPSHVRASIEQLPPAYRDMARAYFGDPARN